MDTLGLAYMRSAEYEKALTTLDEGVTPQTSTPGAMHLFVEAMCQHRLGQIDEAQLSYAKGVDRLSYAAQVAVEAYLLSFQAEVEKLIRINR